MKIYRATVRSMMTYEQQNVVLARDDKERPRVFEMKT